MSTQFSLFPTAPQPRSSVAAETRAALRAVEENADARWLADALTAVQRVCLARAEFFVDDVWATGLQSTREDRALGIVMRRAAREGWCVKTDRVRPSKRSHLSGKPVWRSLIYGGAL